MDFQEFIEQAEKRISKNFNAYYRKIDNLTKMENAQAIAKLESTETNNYLIAIYYDLKGKVEDELLNKYTLKEVEALLEGVFIRPSLQPVQLERSRVIKKVVYTMNDKPSIEEKEDIGARDNLVKGICIGTGSIVGCVVGTVATESLVGTVVGVIGGAALGYAVASRVTEGERVSKPIKDTKEELVEEVVDNMAFMSIMKDREQTVKKFIKEYILQAEKHYHQANRG